MGRPREYCSGACRKRVERAIAERDTEWEAGKGAEPHVLVRVRGGASVALRRRASELGVTAEALGESLIFAALADGAMTPEVFGESLVLAQGASHE